MPDVPVELLSCSPEPTLPPPGSEQMRDAEDQAAWGVWIASIGFAYRDCHYKLYKLIEWLSETKALINATAPHPLDADKK